MRDWGNILARLTTTELVGAIARELNISSFQQLQTDVAATISRALNNPLKRTILLNAQKMIQGFDAIETNTNQKLQLLCIMKILHADKNIFPIASEFPELKKVAAMTFADVTHALKEYAATEENVWLSSSTLWSTTESMRAAMSDGLAVLQQTAAAVGKVIQENTQYVAKESERQLNNMLQHYLLPPERKLIKEPISPLQMDDDPKSSN